MSEAKRLTASAGALVANNQDSLTAGPRDMVLIQGYQLIERLAHQNREGSRQLSFELAPHW